VGSGAGGGDGGVGLARLGQHLVEMAGALRDDVQLERKRRHQPHPELLADLGPQHPLGRLQRGRGRSLLGLLTEDGVVDRGVLAVAREPYVGHGDEPETRVLDPPLEHLGHDHLDPVGDLADARVGHS
jgi:hypothetical protein